MKVETSKGEGERKMGEVYNMYTTTEGKLRWFDTETGEHTYNPNKPTFTESVDSYSISKTINPPTICGRKGTLRMTIIQKGGKNDQFTSNRLAEGLRTKFG